MLGANGCLQVLGPRFTFLLQCGAFRACVASVLRFSVRHARRKTFILRIDFSTYLSRRKNPLYYGPSILLMHLYGSGQMLLHVNVASMGGAEAGRAVLKLKQSVPDPV